MLNKNNQSSTIRIILILLCLTTAQADACLERVKKWWAKPAKKSAATRTTTVLLPTVDNPFPPEIALIVLEYLKKTEEAVYVKMDHTTHEIDHIGICYNAHNLHFFADPRAWIGPKPVSRISQKRLQEIYGLLLQRHHDISVIHREEKCPSIATILAERHKRFLRLANPDAQFLLVERHHATEQTTERFFFMPGPEELYLQKQSQKKLLSCCRKIRGRIMMQEEKEEKNKEE